MNRSISIFLVDDHKVFSQSFETYIHTQNDFLWKGSGDGDGKTITNILQQKPDIVLLDYHLAVSTGLDTLEKLRAKQYIGYIIILTMNRDPHVKLAVKTHGANGFVSKETDGNELLLGIRQLFLGEISFLEIPQNLKDGTNNPYLLTQQEINIADLVCAGLDSDEISKRLNISVHTVNTHRRRILSKTQSDNFVQVCLKIKPS